MDDNEKRNGATGDIGFCGVLAIVFIVLKLVGVISWSWVWVLAPIWIPAAIVVVILLLFIIAIIVSGGRR